MTILEQAKLEKPKTQTGPGYTMLVVYNQPTKLQQLLLHHNLETEAARYLNVTHGLKGKSSAIHFHPASVSSI